MSAYGKPIKAFSKLLDQTAKRATKARAKGKKAPSQYKAEDFVADVVGFWFDSVQAWLEIASPGSASVPVCFIKGAVGSQPRNVLSLSDSLDAPPGKPDLVGVKLDGAGNPSAAVIQKNKMTFNFVDADTSDEIDVQVDLTGATQGLYQGLVYDGNQLLGTILVQVT